MIKNKNVQNNKLKIFVINCFLKYLAFFNLISKGKLGILVTYEFAAITLNASISLKVLCLLVLQLNLQFKIKNISEQSLHCK